MPRAPLADFGPSRFAIFDAFPDETGRDAECEPRGCLRLLLELGGAEHVDEPLPAGATGAIVIVVAV